MRVRVNHKICWISLFKITTILATLPAALVIFQKPVNAVNLTGRVTDFYHSFNGTLSAVELDLGSGLVSTGEISYSLDLTNPSEQRFTFDFDTMTATAELDFLVTFPLLQSLNQSPIRIHISESGPIISGVPDLPVGDNQSLQFRALLIGGGIVTDNSIFSGLEYRNLNDTIVNKNVNVSPGGTFNQNINGGGNIAVNIEGTIQQPGSNPSITVGTGGATIATEPVPEPLTIFGSAMALGLGSFFKKEYSRKQKKVKSLEKQKA
jgi:hypothetical protein